MLGEEETQAESAVKPDDIKIQDLRRQKTKFKSALTKNRNKLAWLLQDGSDKSEIQRQCKVVTEIFEGTTEALYELCDELKRSKSDTTQHSRLLDEIDTVEEDYRVSMREVQHFLSTQQAPSTAAAAKIVPQAAATAWEPRLLPETPRDPRLSQVQQQHQQQQPSHLEIGSYGASQFQLVNQGCLRAPVYFYSVSGSSKSVCTAVCAQRSDCFGFYWVQGTCYLFTPTAFFWESLRTNLVQCKVFTRQFVVGPQRKLQTVGCSQSSTLGGYGCGGALDGIKDQSILSYSCSHTFYSSPREWWEAYLSGPYLLSYVTIYNRQDCCAERLNQFSLQVDGTECNGVNLGSPFSVSSFTCAGSRVRVTTLQAVLFSICEFEAYGQLITY